MALDLKAPGLSRYFYEYMFYRAVERVPSWAAKQNGAEVAPLRTSQGREARARLEQILESKGQTIDSVGVKTFMESADEALSSLVPDHAPLFRNPGLEDPAYKALNRDFSAMIGASGQDPAGGVVLPVSPYDPRWSMRESVLESGTELLAVDEPTVRDALAISAGQGYGALSQMAGANAFTLLSAEVDDNGRRREAGLSNTLNDVSGMSALRSYMSAAEYRKCAPWVAAGAETDDGQIDATGFMSTTALNRSLAILDYLNEQGIDYTVGPDLNEGQIRARLTGTGIDVRLTDTAQNEAYVGRVYDGGIATLYSTGQNQGRSAPYVPTASQSVDLLKFAMGRPVERLDGKGLVGVPGERAPVDKQVQEAYHLPGMSKAGAKAMFMTAPGLYIRQDAENRSARTTWFEDSEAALSFLESAVDTAAANVREAIGAEALVEEAMSNLADPDYVPELSGPEDVVALKQDYWRMLTDADSGVLLLNPGVTAADYADAVSRGDSEAAAAMSSAMDAGPHAADKIRAHAEMVADSMIGTLEPGEGGLRFDPVKVAEYMSSEHGTWRNNDDIVAALRKTRIEASELRGNEFYNRVIADNLIDFDESTSVDISEHPSGVVRRIGDRLASAVQRHAADVTSIRIDDNGVVRWTAERRVGDTDDRTVDPVTLETKHGAKRQVTGTIGQIFGRGEHGEVVTKFAGGENYLFVPGYEATVVPQRPGENKSLEERTRLRGYEQILGEAVEHAVSSDLLSPRSEVGTPTSLNQTLRSLSTTRHPVDYIELSEEEGLSAEWRDRILRTEGLRVRYPNSLRDGSTALRHRQAEMSGFDERNDNDRSPLVLTGNRNMSVLEREAGAGIFDPMMTGTADNQGVVRYLVPSARVDSEGFITAGDPDDRVPVASHEDSAEMTFDPHDRQNMTYSNIMQASAVVPGASTAMTQLGGWNFEDGIVVSARFAAENMIRDTDGNMRPLTVGDKLSDFHGNKGVVSLIVDPEMDPQVAAEAGLEDAVATFAANPELDVVLSPFSAISRFNGGTAREMMESPADLVGVDGEVVPGGRGALNLIVTHMAVDAKTNVYDAQARREGKGRKASSQLAWALQSQGCVDVFKDFYKDNTAGLSNAKEYMLLLGMNIDADGGLSGSLTADSLADRHVFELPEPVRFANGAGKVDHRTMNREFGTAISHAGGLMELPFEIRLANGDKTPRSPENPDRFVLPVLGAHLRSEQSLGDGSVSRHDHTNRYLSIFEQGNKYAEAQRLRAEAEAAGDRKTAAKQAAEMSKALGKAQRSYEAMSGDVISRRIESKRNVFKESIMSNRLSHSATAVWTGDPRLAIDQLAMPTSMAVELGVKMGPDGQPEDDGYVMVLRDPVLRDGGVRYMRVAIDDSLTGVALNPVSVKSFDGDFDGDSVGLIGNLGPFAHFEALDKLTVEANLLDLGAGVRQADGTMRYPLATHTSLDVKVFSNYDEESQERLDALVDRANEAYRAKESGELSTEDFLDVNREVMKDLDMFYTDAFDSKDDLIALRFDGLDQHMESVAACYERGGKGSKSKLMEYAGYLGAEPAVQGQGSDRPSRWRDLGAPDPAAMDEKYRGSQAATAFKTQVTGVAGSISQNAVVLLRSQNKLRSACEVSYPATQSILQAKHDPVDAAYRADVLSGPARDLWAGRKMTPTVVDGRYQWSVDTDPQGQPLQATTQEWIKQFDAMYTHDKGMGVPVGIDRIEEVAQALSDPTGRMLKTSREDWEDWPEAKAPLALDKLAYGGKFDDLIEAARKGENLFSGVNANFAPSSVRDNRALLEMGAERSELGSLTSRGSTVENAQRMTRSEWTSRSRGASVGTRPDPFASLSRKTAQKEQAAEQKQAAQTEQAAEQKQAAQTERKPAPEPARRSGPSIKERVEASAAALAAGYVEAAQSSPQMG